MNKRDLVDTMKETRSLQLISRTVPATRVAPAAGGRAGSNPDRATRCSARLLPTQYHRAPPYPAQSEKMVKYADYSKLL